MGGTGDPYRLGWRFWLRHLLRCLPVPCGAWALNRFLNEPFDLGTFALFYLAFTLIALGPALSRHYHS